MGKTKFLVDRKTDKNETIASYLRKCGVSYHIISRARQAEGNIMQNGHVVHSNAKVNEGDVIELENDFGTSTSVCICRAPLDIVFEDEDYLAVNKPAGLSTLPSKRHFENNLSGMIVGYMNTKKDNFVLRIINRLDKDASGIVLVAKNAISASFLADSNKIDKTYIIIACGKIEKCFTVEKNIATIVSKDGINQQKRVVSETGLCAKTFVVPQVYLKNDCTLCKVKIWHGRTHQIRVHLSSHGFPLLGDCLYGKKSDRIERSALHLGEMSFFHPFTKEKIIIEAPLPIDFARIITAEPD